MVFKKCAKCKKNITKKSSSLECSRCDKVVHAEPNCAKLSNKQLNTVRNSPGVEWSCEECLKNVSRRASFLILDDDDGDEDESEEGSVIHNIQNIDTKKLIQDISRELKKTFKEELGSIESSMEFLSEQITTIEQSIKQQANHIKDLENKNQDLQNNNKNLELRVSALEQGMRNYEQQSLSTSLEVDGLPEIPHKDIDKTLDMIAKKLSTDTKELTSSTRLPGKKEKPGPILVQMKSKQAQRQWIDAAKKKSLTVGELMPNASKAVAVNRVYIREALTKHLKTLLYNAKVQLSKSYQFIWCKDGKIFARKKEDSKIYYIRSVEDIKKLENLKEPNIQ